MHHNVLLQDQWLMGNVSKCKSFDPHARDLQAQQLVYIYIRG